MRYGRPNNANLTTVWEMTNTETSPRLSVLKTNDPRPWMRRRQFAVSHVDRFTSLSVVLLFVELRAFLQSLDR